MKPSEFIRKFTVSSTSRRKARYPVWYSERRRPNAVFSTQVRKRFDTYFHHGMPWASAEPFLSREPRTTSARPCTMGSMICGTRRGSYRSEEHTSELQSRLHLVCRPLLEKKKYDNFES